MTAIERCSNGDYEVLHRGENLGRITVYENAFHSRHAYLRLCLKTYPVDMAAQICTCLRSALGKPLQVMLEEQQGAERDFVRAGGFALRRRCYEMEVARVDYAPSVIKEEPVLQKCLQGPEYAACCQFLYEEYKRTHQPISPLTVNFSAFAAELPKTVYYEKWGERIVHCTFVEENEIAYVCSRALASFSGFACAVAEILFAQHDTIEFECDDGDEAAMQLKGLFSAQPVGVCDTFILA